MTVCPPHNPVPLSSYASKTTRLNRWMLIRVKHRLPRKRSAYFVAWWYRERIVIPVNAASRERISSFKRGNRVNRKRGQKRRIRRREIWAELMEEKGNIKGYNKRDIIWRVILIKDLGRKNKGKESGRRGKICVCARGNGACTRVYGRRERKSRGGREGEEGDHWETGWRNKFVASINKCQSYLISKKRIFLGTAIIRSWNDACNLVKFYRSPIFSRAYRRDVAARSLHTPVFSQSMRTSYRSRIKNKVSKELLFLKGKKRGNGTLFRSIRKLWKPVETLRVWSIPWKRDLGSGS